MKKEDAGIFSALLVGLAMSLISYGAAPLAYAGDPGAATAPQQATYIIGKWTMASGGILGATSQNYFHSGTAGQAMTGGGQSTNNFLISGFWQQPSIATGVTPWELRGIPATFVLYQNYPNPFNPTTTIRYGLPQKSSVTLAIFNIFGQQVAQFVKGEMDAGYHEFQFHAEGFASGVYFFRLQAGSFVETKKLLLLR